MGSEGRGISGWEIKLQLVEQIHGNMFYIRPIQAKRNRSQPACVRATTVPALDMTLLRALGEMFPKDSANGVANVAQGSEEFSFRRSLKANAWRSATRYQNQRLSNSIA